MITGAAIGVFVTAGVALLLASSSAQAPRDLTAGTVKAQRFVLQTPDGYILAVLGPERDAGRLSLFDGAGRRRAVLTAATKTRRRPAIPAASEGEPALLLYGADGAILYRASSSLVGGDTRHDAGRGAGSGPFFDHPPVAESRRGERDSPCEAAANDC